MRTKKARVFTFFLICIILCFILGAIALKPGCNALQSLESEVNGILGRVRDICGMEAMKTLPHRCFRLLRIERMETFLL